MDGGIFPIWYTRPQGAPWILAAWRKKTRDAKSIARPLWCSHGSTRAVGNPPGSHGGRRRKRIPPVSLPGAFASKNRQKREIVCLFPFSPSRDTSSTRTIILDRVSWPCEDQRNRVAIHISQSGLLKPVKRMTPHYRGQYFKRLIEFAEWGRTAFVFYYFFSTT